MMQDKSYNMQQTKLAQWLTSEIYKIDNPLDMPD